MKTLLLSVENYVSSLLKENLSGDLGFHGITHTVEVPKAAVEIGQFYSLDGGQMEILLVSAWFHDCGYIHTYAGYEEKSKQIAKSFLTRYKADTEFINSVSACIEATKFPQSPMNLVEMILCDADFFHFTRPTYPRYAMAIRREFEIFLHRVYSDEEWKTINMAMLRNHTYWTSYGKNVLDRFKQVNVILMNFNSRDIL